MSLKSVSAPSSAGFFDGGGMDVHRTGEVTADHEWRRECERRVRALIQREAPDLEEMIFGVGE